MDLNKYQNRALQTAIYPRKYHTMYPAMGLAGEAGEFLNKLKKIYRDADGIFNIENTRDLSKELGDCLWYIANLANDLGCTLNSIAKDNLDKLESRQKRDRLGGSGDNR